MEVSQENKIYTEIVQKAKEDAQFKSDLMANPVETIEKFIGRKIDTSRGKTLVVRDHADGAVSYSTNDHSGDKIIYLDLHTNLDHDNTDYELKEEELETVAGGIWNTFICIT